METNVFLIIRHDNFKYFLSIKGGASANIVVSRQKIAQKLFDIITHYFLNVECF